MTTVSQVLRMKGYDVWTVSPEDSVYAALELMADKDIGALIVLEQGRVVGIFSERDYARKVVLKGKTSRETPVRELMTRHVVSVEPAQNMQDCMELMTEKRVRHLPVMDQGRVVGVLSIGDVVKEVIGDQKRLIAHLEGYITGKG